MRFISSAHESFVLNLAELSCRKPYLVPRGRDPFGQRQGSGAVGTSCMGTKQRLHRAWPSSIVTLRSNDADGNENVKRTIGLISKTKTSHVHHTFLYISFPFLHDYDVKMPNFAFYGGRKQATTKFYFSF